MKTKLSAMLLLYVSILSAAEFFVDFNAPNNGDGSYEKPFTDLPAKQLKPGDRITLLPSAKPIRRNLFLKDLQGTREQPIIIDGNMNVFCGTLPLDPAQWENRGNGRFVCKRPFLSTMVDRYFMVIGGRIVRMGRFNKGGKTAPLRSSDSLKPGEWTVVRVSGDGNDKRRGIYEFHLQLASNITDPAQVQAEEPALKLVSGVMVFGGCRYLVIRNFIVQHFLNDGYNIHHHNENIRFENIAAVECGDDGLSAHQDGSIEVENYVALGNSTAIAHINQAVSSHRNIYAEGNLGQDLLFTQQSVNTFENLFVRLSAARGISVKNSGGEFRLSGGIWLCEKKGIPITFATSADFRCTISNSTVVGFNGKLPTGCQQVQENDPKTISRMNAARTKLFALFGGRLEQLWNVDKE